jgi:uncharacterized protein (DUF302 family)
MLQMHSIHRLDQVEIGMRHAAERHGAVLHSVTHVGEAVVFNLGLDELYTALLRLDYRFAAFLPLRVAACAQGAGVSLQALSPREFCRILHRPELEPAVAPLEEVLRGVMEEAAQAHLTASGTASERFDTQTTEDQVNMRAALPQRIDSHGTEVEELAGTGAHDAQGG